MDISPPAAKLKVEDALRQFRTDYTGISIDLYLPDNTDGLPNCKIETELAGTFSIYYRYKDDDKYHFYKYSSNAWELADDIGKMFDIVSQNKPEA